MKYIKELFFITVGCLIFAIGVAGFLDPNKLAAGGTTGIAIIMHYFIPLRTGTIIMLINIPVLIFGWWRFGTKFIINTIYATFVSSAMMNGISICVEQYGVITTDSLLAGGAGGALMALGLGIIFLNGATLGGSDIIVKAIRQKYPHMKTSTIYLMSDMTIIAASAVLLQNTDIALYAAITVIISNAVLDKVLYAGDQAKLLYIISEKSEVIVDRIIKEVDIGMTYLKGEGAYSKQRKNIIMCVAKKFNYGKIKQIIKEEDEGAFLIVSGASEVFGYGYKNYYMDEVS